MYWRPISDDRFWAKVAVVYDEQSCWLWQGSLRTTGYGQVRRNRKNWATHRWAYELTYGPIPDGLHIDHLCRVKTCVRPTHLEAVTQQINNARTADPDYCRNGHPRTDSYQRPDGRVECRTCARHRDRIRYGVQNPRVSP